MKEDRKWKEVSLETGEIWDKTTSLEGLFEKVTTNVGPNGSILYTIKTQDGDVGVWGSTVLDDKLRNVPKGTYVKIEYEGKLKSKVGTQYHNYRVFFDENNVGTEEPEISGYLKAKSIAKNLGGAFTDDDIPPEFR